MLTLFQYIVAPTSRAKETGDARHPKVDLIISMAWKVGQLILVSALIAIIYYTEHTTHARIHCDEKRWSLNWGNISTMLTAIRTVCLIYRIAIRWHLNDAHARQTPSSCERNRTIIFGDFVHWASSVVSYWALASVDGERKRKREKKWALPKEPATAEEQRSSICEQCSMNWASVTMAGVLLICFGCGSSTFNESVSRTARKHFEHSRIKRKRNDTWRQIDFDYVYWCVGYIIQFGSVVRAFAHPHPGQWQFWPLHSHILAFRHSYILVVRGSIAICWWQIMYMHGYWFMPSSKWWNIRPLIFDASGECQIRHLFASENLDFKFTRRLWARHIACVHTMCQAIPKCIIVGSL